VIIQSLILSACVMHDARPGWNVNTDSTLRPVDKIEWFIAGQEANVTDTRTLLLTSSWHQTGGRFIFEFHLPPNSKKVSLKFRDKIQGAKVNATAFHMQNTEVQLMNGKRVPGNQFEIELPKQQLNTLRVTIHSHFRRPPVLDEAEIQWKGVIPNDAIDVAAKPGNLIFKASQKSQVQLCSDSKTEPHIHLE
jgi:hypothetical protein